MCQESSGVGVVVAVSIVVYLQHAVVEYIKLPAGKEIRIPLRRGEWVGFNIIRGKPLAVHAHPRINMDAAVGVVLVAFGYQVVSCVSIHQNAQWANTNGHADSNNLLRLPRRTYTVLRQYSCR